MKKETYIASAIRHIKPSYNGNIIAAALFEKTVSLWDITNGKRIIEFETILDFGGSRLALSHVESACLTAAYYDHGLACYDTLTGKLRWQRKELKKTQRIIIAPNERNVYCCFEGEPCQVINIRTGETIERIQRLRNVWIDSRNGYQLRETKGLTVVDQDGNHVFRLNRESFAVLDAAFSQKQMAISEAGGDVRIFDLSSGNEIIRYEQPNNHHVLSLFLTNVHSTCYGVQFNYKINGPRSLLRFRPDTKRYDVICELGNCTEFAFCKRGKLLLTSEGDVINCKTGVMVTKLKFPQKKYPK